MCGLYSSFNIADAMLSLIGSLQPDPFSPAHQPQPATSHFTSGTNRRRSQYSIAEEESVANALMADDSDSGGIVEPFTREQPSSEGDAGEDSDDEITGGLPLDDAFEQLGRETDKLSRELARDAKKSKRHKEEEEAARGEAERQERKERKRKRREERRLNGKVDGGGDEGPAKKKKKKDKGT
jgi:DNA-directed RNA polymerase I subunit RPA43